jgi:hypothetical protein
MKKQDRTGEVRYSANGDKLTITKYTNNKHIEVTNATTGETVNMRYDVFSKMLQNAPTSIVTEDDSEKINGTNQIPDIIADAFIGAVAAIIFGVIILMFG